MKHSFLFLLFLGTFFWVEAQNLNQKLGTDPDVKIGKLANGLTYYIRHNEKPDNKVELRLVVNAGSVLETDAQQGIAHLSEHMAFNGTKHFKKNDLVSYLQSIGVSFGSDLNAYTGFDETVYILPIPTDNPKNITTGFQILQDWAENVTYNDKDIDEERPIVLEESRMGKGANERIMRKLLPEILYGSKYAKRLPIGKDSIIKNASYATVKSFYKEWYRPNLMAVIVVGDIEVNKAEELVKKYFSGLKNPTNEKPRKNYPLLPYPRSSALVVTDPEATSYSFIVNYSAVKTPPEITLGDYKKALEKDIFTSLFNDRLRELTQQANPPFVYASSSFGSNARGYESFNANIVTGNNPDLEGLKAFETELVRVSKFGFLQTELDRVKTTILNNIERAYNERSKTNSSDYVSEYMGNFLNKEPIPGIEAERKYYNELIPKISLSDINAIGKELGKNQNEFIALAGPSAKSNVTLPTVSQILNVRNEVAKLDIKPYVEKALASSLLATTPKAGSITGETRDELMKTTTFSLSNGVEVTIRPTDFKNDQILMSAVRKGGMSNFWKTDKYNVNFLIQGITSMGLGNFSPVDLKKALTGKTVSVAPTLSAISEGMSGHSSVKDLETMLQLTYLYFTSPRLDTALFSSFVQRNKSQLAFLSANPQVVFIDSLMANVYQHSPLAPISVPTVDDFNRLNVDRMMEIYKNIFGNADKMHFYFVGNIDTTTIKPLMEKYLGSLPSSARNFGITDVGLRPVKGTHDINVYKGKDQKALIVRIYSGEVPYSQDLELKAKAVSEVLNIQIIEDLREKIGGIYGGGTVFQIDKYPYPNYELVLQLPCGPEKIDTLLSAFDDLVNQIIANGPSAENLEKVKKQWLEAHRTDVKENSVWLQTLKDDDFNGDNPDYFLNYEKYVKGLTADDIREAAKQLLTTKNIVTGVLHPEK